MVFLSIIPMVGAGLVLYPAAIVLMVTGDVWHGVALFLTGFLVFFVATTIYFGASPQIFSFDYFVIELKGPLYLQLLRGNRFKPVHKGPLVAVLIRDTPK